MKETFLITAEKGQKLADYMDGHGYLPGHMDGRIFRRDSCEEQAEMHWEPYTVGDVVSAANEWNFELLKEAEEALADPENRKAVLIPCVKMNRSWTGCLTAQNMEKSLMHLS